jgi:hypothetical protein
MWTNPNTYPKVGEIEKMSDESDFVQATFPPSLIKLIKA